MADIQGAAALQVESSDSPAKPEDYVVVQGFRLVRSADFVRTPPASDGRRRLAAGGRRRCCQQARQNNLAPEQPCPQVKPYHFDFCCSVRQRWFGQNIIDIFTRVGSAA